jgi:hypothetical protein
MTQSLRPYQERGVAEIGANFAGSARQILLVPSALEVFLARAEGRAHLYAAGELDLHQAVDVLQDAAERTGLVTLIGQDAVQAMMADAFQITQPVHESEALARPSTEPCDLVSQRGVASAAELQRANDRTLAERFRHSLPASTVDALHYAIAQKDPQRLRQFITGRSTQERKQIRAHLQ